MLRLFWAGRPYNICAYSVCKGAIAFTNSLYFSRPSSETLYLLNNNSTSLKLGFFSGAIVVNWEWNCLTEHYPYPSTSKILNASITLKSWRQAKSIRVASSRRETVIMFISSSTKKAVSGFFKTYSGKFY